MVRFNSSIILRENLVAVSIVEVLEEQGLNGLPDVLLAHFGHLTISL